MSNIISVGLFIRLPSNALKVIENAVAKGVCLHKHSCIYVEFMLQNDEKDNVISPWRSGDRASFDLARDSRQTNCSASAATIKGEYETMSSVEA